MTRDELSRLLKQHNTSPWTFTTEVVIDETALPHSHPVLTLSAAWRPGRSDGVSRPAKGTRGDLLLLNYIHEQHHWHCLAHADTVDELCSGELLKRYPDVEPDPPTTRLFLTYQHLIICWHELDVLRNLLGRARAEQAVRDFISIGLLRQVRGIVLTDYDELTSLFTRYQLRTVPIAP